MITGSWVTTLSEAVCDGAIQSHGVVRDPRPIAADLRLVGEILRYETKQKMAQTARSEGLHHTTPVTVTICGVNTLSGIVTDRLHETISRCVDVITSLQDRNRPGICFYIAPQTTPQHNAIRPQPHTQTTPITITNHFQTLYHTKPAITLIIRRTL